MAQAAERVMQAIYDYSGFHHEGDYYFLFYYVDYERLKGLFKSMGLGSALEHKNSSMYYYSDFVWDTTYSDLHHILAHEYYHTITPLNLHSEKIRNFNFAEPNMSRRVWMYEGVADYLANYNNYIFGLKNGTFESELEMAIGNSENRKHRSLTKSGQKIIKKNMFDWVGKVIQLIDFYDKGKLIAFALDVEMADRTDGERRLIDVMEEMKNDYVDQPFSDEKLVEIMTDYTFEEFPNFYKKYIEDGNPIDYDYYMGKFGGKYIPEKTKIPAYSKKWIVPYHYENNKYYVYKIGKNTLGIEKGDTIVSINNIPATLENRNKNPRLFYQLYYPDEYDEQIDLEVVRNGQLIKLSGKSSHTRKMPIPRIITVENSTSEQLEFRENFFKKRNKD